MRRPIYARLKARFGAPIDPLTRRQFLKGSAAAGLALLLSGPQALAAPAKPNGKSVLIIGAGFAGLSVAYEMIAAAYDVTVIVARDRISGRVITFDNIIPGGFV